MTDKNYLTPNRPYSKNVKNQRYYSCSMLTPNSFPLSKRDKTVSQDVYGFQVHGVYENEEEMREHCLKLQKVIKNFDVLPNEIGNLVDFDIDICEYEDAEIVYREEELNNINKKEFTKDLEKEVKTEEVGIVSENTDDLTGEMNINRFTKKDKTFVNQVKHHNFVCVSYISKEMLKNIPEKSKNKKFVGHIVHGIFEKFVDAQKYQHMMSKEFPMMVVDKVGEMNIVHSDLNVMKDDKVRDIHKPSLNSFMKLYMDCLEEDGNDEKIRKEAQLQGAEIVTGKYDEYIGASKKTVVEKDEKQLSENTGEVKFPPKETEEQKLNRALKESSDRKAKLEEQKNISYSTTEEFEEKLKEIKTLHNMINK
jgi:hypothetical protein